MIVRQVWGQVAPLWETRVPELGCTVLSPLMRMMTPCMRLKQESAAPKSEAHTYFKIEDQVHVVDSVCLKRRKEGEVKEKENGKQALSIRRWRKRRK